MTKEEKQIEGESAADVVYHQMYDCGATMEDCVNAAQEAYEEIVGEKMENILDFFGIDEDMWEDCKDL